MVPGGIAAATYRRTLRTLRGEAAVCRILFSQHYRYVFCAKQCCCPCHCNLCS